MHNLRLLLFSGNFGLPRGFYKSVFDIENNFSREKGFSNQAIHIETIIPDRKLLFSSEARKLDSDPDNNNNFSRYLEYPRKIVCEIPQGRIFGTSGAVISSDNRLIADLSVDFGVVKKQGDIHEHSIFKSLKLPKPVYFDGRVAALVAPAGGNNYFHWMIDVLPQIHLLRCSSISLESIDKFAFN